MPFSRNAMIDGAKAVLPLGVPGIPFGLVFGVTVNQSNVDNLAGWSASLFVVGGAAQIAAIGLLAGGASVATVVLTIALIQGRHAMYSAALSSRFKTLPRWFRIIAPYMLIDQIFAVADSLDHTARDQPVDDNYRMSHYAGSAILMWSIWMTSSTIGVFVGQAIPESWSIEFTVPLVFIGLLVLSVKNAPAFLAAVLGGTVAVMAADFPNGSGLVAGALVGMVAGGIADWMMEERSVQEAKA